MSGWERSTQPIAVSYVLLATHVLQVTENASKEQRGACIVQVGLWWLSVACVLQGPYAARLQPDLLSRPSVVF